MTTGHKLSNLTNLLDARGNPGAVDVRSFGAVGDGVDDQTANQAALTAEQNECVTIPSGRFKGDVSANGVAIKGNGIDTILEPATAVALTLDRHITAPAHDWTRVELSGFTIQGDAGKTFDGIAFSEPLSGRYKFESLYFEDLDKAIEKAGGNIGNVYSSVTVRDTNFGMHVTGSASTPMHSGSDTMRDVHWDTVEQACYYIKETVDGAGGWVVRDSIAEQCNGFFLWGDFGNKTPYTPPVLENVWLEAMAKNATTTIDGTPYTTRELRIKDCPAFRIRDMYLKSAEILNSTVHGDCIRMDDAIGSPPDLIIDADSSLVIDNLYGDGEVGGLPFVRSIMRQANTSNTKNLSVRGPLAQSRIRSSSYNGANVYSNVFSGPGPFPFAINGGGTNNVPSVNDGVLDTTCAEITVPAGQTHFDQASGIPTSGRWVVWSTHAKLISGDIANANPQLAFDMILGKVYLRLGQWVRSYGIQKTSTVGAVRLFIDNNNGTVPLVMRFADVFVREFNTYEEAHECVNSMKVVAG